MNKKVLILSASPRKGGNSDCLCDQFFKGAEEAGNMVEKIFLGDKKIAYCVDCGTCAGEKNPCAIRDDMGEILEKMIAADVIVMATPVYFYSMCAQMKTLIDRTCARSTQIVGKDFYFIMTAADKERKAMTQTLEGLRAFTSCLKGVKEKGIVYGIGVAGVGEILQTEYVKQAYEMGRNIV